MKKIKKIEQSLLYMRKVVAMELAQALGNDKKAYQELEISKSTFYSWKKEYDKHGKEGLDRTTTRKSMVFKRYAKLTLGHHVQMDVKFLIFPDKFGEKIKRYQYTAIDDCTRVRALKIYEKHNQISSIDFVNYVIEKYPCRACACSTF